MRSKWIRLMGHVRLKSGLRNAVREPEGKEPLGRIWLQWRDNIKIILEK
jgi:hypothetical protein